MRGPRPVACCKWGKWRPGLVPFGTLFVRIASLKNRRFVQFFAENLKTYRKLFSLVVRKPARDADPTDASHVCSQGEDVRQVHAERIAGALPKFKCGSGGGRTCHYIHFFEGFCKIFPNQTSNLLSPQVIRVIIPGTQYV